MADGFRLLHSSGVFERRDLLKQGRIPSELHVEFSEKHIRNAEDPWVSVVIGKNGVGKSRLLAGIADIFDNLYRETGRRRSDDLGVSHVSYWCDGHFCQVEFADRTPVLAKVDGQNRRLTDLPLPTKVIALTTTPFDKFRISRSLMRMPGVDESDASDSYAYLGLRDRTGRASPTAAIFRALEGLFEASKGEEERRYRISEVFRFLGYEPKVAVRYEFANANFERLKKIAYGASVEEILGEERPSDIRRPLERILHRDQYTLERMRGVANEALQRARGGTLTLRADFESRSRDEYFFRELQLLRKADLMRMRAVEVERLSDGAVLDLRLASSGELGLVTGFLGLASVIEDGSLIFIDEPEISLHPEWQTQYIGLLLRTFGSFRGCHYVLATHSPLILSDLPGNANVVSLDPDRREAEPANEFAGQSSDSLLVTAFHVPGKNNLYLKQEVIKALRLAAQGKAATKEYDLIVGPLIELLPKMEDASPVAQLIRQLQDAKELKVTS